VSVHQKEALSGYLRKRHSVSKLLVHLVFTINFRRKLLNAIMIEQLRKAFISSCNKLECELVEMDGEADHVHLLISYPPKLAVSVMVNNLKAVSSRAVRIQNPALTKQSNNGVLWSRSYFACTAGGATIDALKVYIQNQSTPE